MSNSGMPLPGDGELLLRLVLIPSLLSLMVFAMLTVRARQLPAAPAVALDSAVAERKAFTARVVGVQWLNPLHQRDRSTEWELLWTLGRTQRESRDHEVKGDPSRFAKPQALGPIASVGKDDSPNDLHSAYLAEMLGTLHSVDPGMAPTRVEYVISAERLDGTDVARQISQAMTRTASVCDKRPEIQVTAGGANAGFAALAAAISHLRQNPAAVVWLMGWDAPNFPFKQDQTNENMVLLILAGPDAVLHRKALARIGMPAASRPATTFTVNAGGTRRVAQAWKSVLDTTAENNNCSAEEIAYAIHDADTRIAASAEQLVGLAQTLTAGHPEFDFAKQAFNSASLLGDMAASAALTNLAMAVAHANHVGGKVLIAGTSDTERAMAAIVLPPGEPRPIDPNREWFRAAGEHQAFLPWQGLRLDSASNLQGFSD